MVPFSFSVEINVQFDGINWGPKTAKMVAIIVSLFNTNQKNELAFGGKKRFQGERPLEPATQDSVQLWTGRAIARFGPVVARQMLDRDTPLSTF